MGSGEEGRRINKKRVDPETENTHDKYEQYIKKDFPAFIKKLRNDLLDNDETGEELGVTKNHVAKMSRENLLWNKCSTSFFDLVEKKLTEGKTLEFSWRG